MSKHRYFRVYPNGDRSTPIFLTTGEKEELVAFNRVMRFGCAQFVDGKCVYPANIPKDIILSVEK